MTRTIVYDNCTEFCNFLDIILILVLVYQVC